MFLAPGPGCTICRRLEFFGIHDSGGQESLPPCSGLVIHSLAGLRPSPLRYMPAVFNFNTSQDVLSFLIPQIAFSCRGSGGFATGGWLIDSTPGGRVGVQFAAISYDLVTSTLKTRCDTDDFILKLYQV